MSAMFCAFSSRSLSVFQILLFLYSAFYFPHVHASIRVVGKEYQSRNDKYVGLQMKEGLEYDARLQRIPGDQHFCGNGHWNVTVPDDDLPVALVVKKGLCSSAQKAEFASQNIHPKGVVKFLIIDGEVQIKDEDDDEYKCNYESEDNQDRNYNLYETTHTSSNETVAYYNRGDKNKMALRRGYTDDIAVVLMHVSYRTGYELNEIILTEDTDVKNAGGTRVTVDPVSPPLAGAVMIVWTAVFVAVSIFVCCCIATALEDLFESQEPEPELPRRPRRQRLTIEQVRRQFSVGIFDGNELIYEEETATANEKGEDSPGHLVQQSNDKNFLQPATSSLDACTICLDDYRVGHKLRCLPCGHAFHARCIAKWLIERSAVCPLCKLDVYEEEADDDEEDEHEIYHRQERDAASPMIVTEIETNEGASTTENSIGSWWRAIFSSSPEQRRWMGNSGQDVDALTEPLLQQQEQSENPTLADMSVEAVPTNEESNSMPTSNSEEIPNVSG